MEELKCSACGATLQAGEPHCHMCHKTMSCKDGTCTCDCGNMVSAPELKCDNCLGM